MKQCMRKGTEWRFVNSADADQLLHSHSVNKLYTVHILLSQDCKKIMSTGVDSDKT